MGKKIVKIVGVILILIIAVLIAAPFFLEAKIGDIIKNNVNNNVNATLDFSDADLSLFSSFPNAEVQFKDVVLINKVPFEGDTLFKAKDLGLTMGIMQLFKSTGDPIAINNINLEDAFVNIVVDKEENANYDITKASESTATQESTTTDGFSFLDFIHFAVASATLATFSTVNSRAIMALQPSVPNLIFVIFLFHYMPLAFKLLWYLRAFIRCLE